MLSDFTDIDDILGERLTKATIRLNYSAPRCAGLTGCEDIAGTDTIPNTATFDAPLWVIGPLYADYSDHYYNDVFKDISSPSSRYLSVDPSSCVRITSIELSKTSASHRLATDLVSSTDAKYIDFSGIKGCYISSALKLIELLYVVVMKHSFNLMDTSFSNVKSNFYPEESGIFDHRNIIRLASLSSKLGNALLSVVADRYGECIRKAATSKGRYLADAEFIELLSSDEWAVIDSVVKTCNYRLKWLASGDDSHKQRKQ